MAQHYDQHSPDRIIEIPNDPAPPNSVVSLHLPPGQLYHRYPSTSTGSSFSTPGGGANASKLRSILCWTLFIVIVFILTFLIFVFAFYIALKPKSPKFSIHDFVDSGDVGRCKLSLNADNPNAHMGLFVKHDGGGFASLYLDQREIARGRPPDVYLGKSNTTRFEVWLEGLRDGVRGNWEEGEEMRFEMDVKVKLKLWLVKAWDMEMDVTCRFRASRHVSNGTHVVSQTCRDKIKF